MKETEQNNDIDSSWLSRHESSMDESNFRNTLIGPYGQVHGTESLLAGTLDF